jgi:hypothetical protein
MVFQNSGAGFRQSSATTGNAVVQSFDIVCRFLGTGMVDTISSDSGKPAGDTTPSKGTQFFVFQLQSTGKASVPIGAGYMRYFANRELYLNTVP